jgi:hypothetical protein
MTDNITQFPTKQPLPENPIELAPRPAFYCGHESVIVDEHSRTIQCANLKCGATLDAFDFVRTQSAMLARAWSRHKEVMRDAYDVADRVAKLKREEQRLRAMVKRLQEKSGSLVTPKDIV